MISHLEQKNGRTPTETEIAEALGMGVNDCQRLLDGAYRLVSYEDLGT